MKLLSEPLERFKPTTKQKNAFLKALANGHSDAVAVLRAECPVASVSDMIAAIGPDVYAEARAKSELPVAVVRERANDIMLAARDEEHPMALRDVVDILKLRDKDWRPNANVNLVMPQPILDVEAVIRASNAMEGEKVISGELE